MNLEEAMLSAISWSWNDKDCVIPFVQGTYNSHSQRIRAEQGVPGASGEGEMESH